MTALILASTSRYRRELLARLGQPFETASPGVDESRLPGESPLALARRLALAKAAAVADRQPDALVIGSDQLAQRDDEVLGKPGTVAACIEQLERSSGREVVFVTALAMLRRSDGFRFERVDLTRVKFRELSRAEIEAYVAAEQPLDCAGGFKSEARGIALFERIESVDPTALVGLPLIAVCEGLRRAGG